MQDKFFKVFVICVPSKTPLIRHTKPLIIIFLLAGVKSFPDGAPLYQCADAYPRHGYDAQPSSTPVPYEITTSRDVYAPGDIIESKYTTDYL